MNHQETLSLALWQRRLQRIVHALSDEDRDDGYSQIEHLLRQAFYLSCIAPHPFTRAIMPQCCEEDFEQLLGCGYPDAAAIQLIGSGVGMFLDDQVSFELSELASVLAESPEPAEAVARDILATWVNAMLGLALRIEAGPGMSGADQVVQQISV